MVINCSKVKFFLSNLRSLLIYQSLISPVSCTSKQYRTCALCALLLHICFAGTQASYYLCSSCTSKQHWTCALYAFLLHLCFAGTHFSTKMSKRNQNYRFVQKTSFGPEIFRNFIDFRDSHPFGF